MSVDSHSVTLLIDRHAVALRAVAAQWSDTPEDLVQEAFCRLIAQKTPPKEPAAWLFRVVRNLAHKQYRACRRRQSREAKRASPSSYGDTLADQLDAKTAVDTLQHLEVELREIVIMRLWGSLTLEEIATACETSVATVHRRYHAAIQQIRKEMKVECQTNQRGS